MSLYFPDHAHNPNWNSSVSEIFARHCKRVKHKQSEKEPDNQRQAKDGTGRLNSSNFVPRLVPFDFTEQGIQACENYKLLSRIKKLDSTDDIGISFSMKFLLSVCCELIDIRMDDMYRILFTVQGVFCEGTLMPLQKLLAALPHGQHK